MSRDHMPFFGRFREVGDDSLQVPKISVLPPDLFDHRFCLGNHPRPFGQQSGCSATSDSLSIAHHMVIHGLMSLEDTWQVYNSPTLH